MSRRQCSELTKSGSRCKILTKNGVCHKHKKVYLSTDPNLFNNPNMTEDDFLNVKLISKKHNTHEKACKREEKRLDEPFIHLVSLDILSRNIETRSSRRKTLGSKLEREKKSFRLSLDFAHQTTSGLVDMKETRPDDYNCCVCYETVTTKDKLKCSHFLCKSCIMQMRDIRCPICRMVMSSKDISFENRILIQERKREDEIERSELALQEYLLTYNH